MLIKKWSCNLFEIFFWKRFKPLSTNYLKGGMHATTPKGRNLKKEKLWIVRMYQLQQKQVKIQQEFRSYHSGY